MHTQLHINIYIRSYGTVQTAKPSLPYVVSFAFIFITNDSNHCKLGMIYKLITISIMFNFR